MKKFFKALMAMVTIFVCSLSMTSCLIDSEEVDFSIKGLSQNEVYFLYEPGCTYSVQARNYIKTAYPAVKMREIDIFKEDAYRKAARTEYGLWENMKTPIICFGENYIAGWDEDNKIKLDSLIQRYR